MNTAKEVIAIFNERAAAISNQIDMLSRCIVGNNTVVRTSPGLYLRFAGGVEFYPVGVEACSRWTPEDGARIAADCSNGAGDKATAVLLIDALRDEQATLAGLIAALEKVAA